MPARFGPLALAVLLVLAGCVGGAPGGATTDDSTTDADPTTETTPTATDATTTGVPPNLTDDDPATSPDPPATLTDAAAAEVALAAEAASLYRRLNASLDPDDFGLSATTAQAAATVLNRSDGGVYVRVRHPYSWNADGQHADGLSEAVYFVTTERVDRRRGTDVSVPSVETTPDDRPAKGTQFVSLVRLENQSRHAAWPDNRTVAFGNLSERRQAVVREALDGQVAFGPDETNPFSYYDETRPRAVRYDGTWYYVRVAIV